MTVMPMFPLSIVHFPGVVLPLRVFEPRYRALTARCLESDSPFGVVLIERGSEVGGGDTRFEAGTATAIVHADLDTHGHVQLRTVGTRRIKVERWLPDDPYPLADVRVLESPHLGPGDMAALEEAEHAVRRAMAAFGALEERAPAADTPVSPNPAEAMFQLAALAPLGPVDQQRLVAEEDTARFLALLSELAGDAAAFFDQQLGR